VTAEFDRAPRRSGLPERSGGWRGLARPSRVAPQRRRLRALSAQRTHTSYPQFPQRCGECFLDPKQQPERAPAPKSEPPGEFVSEDLRADCARFLEELRAQIEGRADLPPGSTGWLPGRVE
jgi:hypothetical protein